MLDRLEMLDRWWTDELIHNKNHLHINNTLSAWGWSGVDKDKEYRYLGYPDNY